MLAATVGLGLLVGIGALSARAVRWRVSYHTWYFVHLYTYIALALSFAHQFNTGADFATHPLNRVIWAAMYGVVAALLIGYRVVTPLVNLARYRFVVVGAPTRALTWSRSTSAAKASTGWAPRRASFSCGAS